MIRPCYHRTQADVDVHSAFSMMLKFEKDVKVLQEDNIALAELKIRIIEFLKTTKEIMSKIEPNLSCSIGEEIKEAVEKCETRANVILKKIGE